MWFKKINCEYLLFSNALLHSVTVNLALENAKYGISEGTITWRYVASHALWICGCRYSKKH